MDLISIDSLSDDQIERILDRGLRWFEYNRSDSRGEDKSLRDKLVFNLFYENSTRTAMSFATAAHRLGASPVFLPVEQSSIKKGETFDDTARTLNAMRPDCIVIRHRENGAPARMAELADCAVINAGRRNQRTPDAGSAGRPRPQDPLRRPRRPEDRDLRRHPAQPRCPVQCQAPSPAGCRSPACGPAVANAGRRPCPLDRRSN